jgi:hypothetical protein
VFGLDAAGDTLVFGATLPFQFGELDGLRIPIFVQRTGEWARLPGPLSDARPAPLLSPLQGQYLLVSGGGDPSLATRTQLYDFAQFAPAPHPPTLPRAPASVAVVGSVALLIDQTGATYFDFSSGASAEAPAPAGGSFADVAGGATIVADDGTEYVVGATRASGSPTASVLVIHPSDTSVAADLTGKLAWASLSAPRLSAWAVWAVGHGLVVGGGNAMAPGVEVLAPGSVTGAGLGYPPDASQGAGAALLDAQDVLVAGGVTPAGGDAVVPAVRVLPLACAGGCVTTTWAQTLPAVLSVAQTFSIVHASTLASAGSGSSPTSPTDPTGGASRGLVVGDGPDGVTRVFRVGPSDAVDEVPTKVPHNGARAWFSPVGSVVVFGGAAGGEMESFAP